MDKIDETISVIEESKIEAFQEKLAEDKKIILKQEKLLTVTDREEDGWEVVKCYMSDDLASDSDDEMQISRASREAATNRKKKEENKQKDEKKQFWNDNFTTFDLLSGYPHIIIHTEHRKFLPFEWTYEDGSTKYFQSCVLPFCLL